MGSSNSSFSLDNHISQNTLLTALNIVFHCFDAIKWNQQHDLEFKSQTFIKKIRFSSDVKEMKENLKKLSDHLCSYNNLSDDPISIINAIIQDSLKGKKIWIKQEDLPLQLPNQWKKWNELNSEFSNHFESIIYDGSFCMQCSTANQSNETKQYFLKVPGDKYSSIQEAITKTVKRQTIKLLQKCSDCKSSSLDLLGFVKLPDFLFIDMGQGVGKMKIDQEIICFDSIFNKEVKYSLQGLLSCPSNKFTYWRMEEDGNWKDLNKMNVPLEKIDSLQNYCIRNINEKGFLYIRRDINVDKQTIVEDISIKRQNFLTCYKYTNINIIQNNERSVLMKGNDRYYRQVLLEFFEIKSNFEYLKFRQIENKIKLIEPFSIIKHNLSIYSHSTNEYMIENIIDELSDLDSYLEQNIVTDSFRCEIFIQILQLLKTMIKEEINCPPIKCKEIKINQQTKISLPSFWIFHQEMQEHENSLIQTIDWLKMLLSDLFPSQEQRLSLFYKRVISFLNLRQDQQGKVPDNFVDKLIEQINSNMFDSMMDSTITPISNLKLCFKYQQICLFTLEQNKGAFTLSMVKPKNQEMMPINQNLFSQTTKHQRQFNQQEENLAKHSINFLNHKKFYYLRILKQSDESLILSGRFLDQRVLIKVIKASSITLKKYEQLSKRLLDIKLENIIKICQTYSSSLNYSHFVVCKLASYQNINPFLNSLNDSEEKRISIFTKVKEIINQLQDQKFDCSFISLDDIWLNSDYQPFISCLSLFFEQTIQNISQSEKDYPFKSVFSQLFSDNNSITYNDLMSPIELNLRQINFKKFRTTKQRFQLESREGKIIYEDSKQLLFNIHNIQNKQKIFTQQLNNQKIIISSSQESKPLFKNGIF